MEAQQINLLVVEAFLGRIVNSYQVLHWMILMETK